VNTPAVFTKKDLLIKGYQVMQRWEDNYMKSLAAVASSKGGEVLEIGFGLGMSAGYIERSKKLRHHNIIECHPEVIKLAKSLFSEQIRKGRIKILEGFWEDITPNLPDKSFDGILFDSCPLDSGVEFFQFFPFFEEAFRLLKDDGIFTYFSDEATEISETHARLLKDAGFENIQFKICRVKPPKTCEYWKHSTIVVPLVRKYKAK
jgi:guanidinoacetate N-methyltransferase